MPEKNNLDEKTIIANVADWQLITIHNNKTGDLMTLKYNFNVNCLMHFFAVWIKIGVSREANVIGLCSFFNYLHPD